MTLQQFFAQVPKAALAFSGGTDSAFLMWASRQYGCALRAYYIKTAFQPAFELADARRLAEELGVPMTVVELDVLSVPEAAENGPRRCYYCKKALFTRDVYKRQASAPGSTLITLPDGSTVDLGHFDTADAATKAVQEYLEQQVSSGNMTQAEADNLLDNGSIE